MKSKTIETFFIFLFAAQFLSSCATFPEPGQPMTEAQRRNARIWCFTQYTALGAVGGAALGAGSQAISGGNVGKGAAIGGAVGAGLGFAYAWGHCFALYSNLNSSPTEIIKDKYSEDYEIEIENFSIDPDSVYSGEKCSMKGLYFVTVPKGIRDLKVLETRFLEYYDDSKKMFVCTLPEGISNEVIVEPGVGRKLDGDFDAPDSSIIPQDLKTSRWRIKVMISAQGKSDIVEKEFQIIKKG